jgi:hypothetical protein
MKLMPEPYANRLERHVNGFRRKRAEADRWTTWAKGFHAQYLRIGYRCRALALVLAGNHAFSLQRVDKWYCRSLQLFANLRLSIGPFIQRPNARQIAPIAGPTFKEFASPGGSSNGQSPPDHQLSVRQNLLPLKHSFSIQHAGDISRAPILLPIERVSSRLHETFQRQLIARFEVPFIVRSFELTNRVINERQRLEERTRRTVITTSLREYPKPSTAKGERTSESERTMQSVSARTSHMPGGSPLDLERLTDQVVRNIDSRMVAHRERMGNVF